VRETLVLKNDKHLIVPKRAFGHTGVKISKLCLGGGSFGSTDSQDLLDDALKYGVDCWEIVSFSGNVYRQYFKENPGIREKVFLSAKIYSTHPIIMQEQLDNVLKENGTATIDFLAIHPVDDIKVLNDDVRKWVAKVKKQEKVRFFGFCTHKNMAACLSGAAELGWIDGIQTVYNYRMRNVKSVEEALKKCHAKGIGIFAVKSMGLCVQKKNELQKLPLHKEKLDALLSEHKVSFEQVKLKSIWQNPNLTSICSLMPNASILRSNVAAAVDERSLHPDIVKLLADYDHITAKYFCQRCGTCEPATEEKVPIFDIMEMLMYLRGYGKKKWAVKRFSQLPIEIQSKIRTSNYSRAEEKCPQQMPITQLMQEAYDELRPV
jgi:uncharacterized protein